MVKNSVKAIYSVAVCGILYTLYLLNNYRKNLGQNEQELSSDYDYKNQGDEDEKELLTKNERKEGVD